MFVNLTYCVYRQAVLRSRNTSFHLSKGDQVILLHSLPILIALTFFAWLVFAGGFVGAPRQFIFAAIQSFLTVLGSQLVTFQIFQTDLLADNFLLITTTIVHFFGWCWFLGMAVQAVVVEIEEKEGVVPGGILRAIFLPIRKLFSFFFTAPQWITNPSTYQPTKGKFVAATQTERWLPAERC